MYAIICDENRTSWWIQGDEGRVDERVFASIDEVLPQAEAMGERGESIELAAYYVNDPNAGPDWSRPIPIEGKVKPPPGRD